MNRAFDAFVLAVSAVFWSGLTAPPAEASVQKGTIESGRFGFALRAPKGWTEIPTQVDEQWLVAKYLSDQVYRYNDDDGWTWEFQPEMSVIAFVKTAEGDDEDEAEEEGETVRIKWGNPYKDYEDYLDRTYRGGGFFIDEREEKKVGKTPVTALRIKVEKLSSAKKYIMAWVYHADGVDVAVQFELLQDSWPKMKSSVNRVFKSFKVIERTEEAMPEQDSLPGWITISQMDEGTPSERRKMRVKSEMQHREKARASLPDGWTAKQMGRCFVLNHVDDRYAKKLVAQVEAVLSWLEEEFPFVGPDEYVREPILRICDGREEENSFRRGSDGWWSVGTEIVTCRDRDDWSDWEVGTVNTQVMSLWFRDRNRNVYFAMPRWINAGLNEYFQDARVRGKKLEFKASDWDRQRLREMRREGTRVLPRNLMRMSSDEFYAQSSSWENRQQARALVTFLLTGKASRSAKTKHLLADYMQNLQAVLAEIEEEDEAELEKDAKTKPETEEEEEQLFKKKRNSWKERERRIVEETFQRTFGDWTEQDWASFEKGYFASID